MRFGPKLIILYLCVICLATASVLAQTSDSPDAIAIRVVANPERWSAARWYKANNFTGSPQSVVVDGYRGVRDGRTVYVNAANIDDRGSIGRADDVLHTNIYLISYNQEAETPTVDIFGQMIKHWRFNHNREEPGNCEKDRGQGCFNDSDCAAGDFCDSEKARIVRDVRRLEDLQDIRSQLEGYKAKNRRYPALAAGSYLKHRTLSVWPSWQKLLAQYLGQQLPEDPVNALAPCSSPAFNPATCWDEASKRFDDADELDPDLNLREGSRVYKFYASETGESYDLCAVMESGYVPEAEAGACSGSASVNIRGQAGNTPPEFTGIDIPLAVSGQPFAAFISAADADGDAISWEFRPQGAWSNWSGPPLMSAAGRPDQRKFSADRAGDTGIYLFSVTINDGFSDVSREFAVPVATRNPPVIDPIGPQRVVVGRDLVFTVRGQEPDGEYPLAFRFTGGPAGFNSAGASAGIRGEEWRVAGTVTDTTRQYAVQAFAVDSAGSPSRAQDFTVTVTNDPPVIAEAPAGDLAACVTAYSFPAVASDPNGHAVTVTVSGLPQGLAYDPAANSISGTVTAAPGTYTYTIRARDQYFSRTASPYSAEAVRSVALNVRSEDFALAAPADRVFYADPSSSLPYVPIYYRSPVVLRLNAGETAAGDVFWRLSTVPSPLPPGIDIAINEQGELHASAASNSLPPGGLVIAVNLRATTAACGSVREAAFNLTAYPNEWCGDAQTQAGEGEECDDGRNGIATDQCDDNCQDTYCGDHLVQSPNGEGASEACDEGVDNGVPCVAAYGGTCDYCAAGCTSATVTGPRCGDNALNGSEACDGADFGPQTCQTMGFYSGSLACSSDCSAISTANCVPYCRFDQTSFGNCVIAP